MCAVGALALARTPRNVRAKVREEGGGKYAKIVDLSESRGGRVRSRIRRQHRVCHQKVVAQEHDLVIATWNTQGGNWAKTEERHVSKFQCLVDEMRSKSVDVMCLTDLHGQMDEQVGVDSRYTTCMIEEFVLIQCGRVGFCLHPAVAKCWDGTACCWDDAGRVSTIEVELDGGKSPFWISLHACSQWRWDFGEEGMSEDCCRGFRRGPRRWMCGVWRGLE